MENKRAFNIAAVSLIEIMMIFTIIGIVTGACVSLTKPKNEYMTKIKLYAAYMTLDQAGKNIASETHIDFTTDVNTCTVTRTNGICGDYNDSTFPGLNSQLPKVVARASESSEVDPGLLTNTPYSNLSASQKEQFKFLQSGLCQRLAKTMNIPNSGINCAPNISSGTLVQTTYPSSFRTETPQLYLPNGQVIYLNKYLWQDYRNNYGTINKSVVYATETQGRSIEAEFFLNNYCSTIQTQIDYIIDGANSAKFQFIPNETRQKVFDVAINDCGRPNTNTVKYWPKMWSKNKDYFIIYVDLNCKMASDSDKKCGPDQLNKDVFAFRMYRDGSVLPDYYSGFPKDALTAKILVKDLTSANGDYKHTTNSAFLFQPLVYSRCYANLAGSYATGISYDHIGICSYGGSTRAPINDCITSDGDSICKSVINRPSFFIR